MQQIYEKFDKKAIAALPRVTFNGRIFTIITEDEAERAVDYLLSQPILGFDTETRPTFKKGRANKVALLQVATHDTCFLFRLNRIGLTPSVIRLLEDKTVLKIGLSLHDDFFNLHHRGDFIVGDFVELQQEVKKLGIMDLSLQKIYANLFQAKISKSQQLSNWEALLLTDAQQQYAAIDAWACIRIYERINELYASGQYQLVREEQDKTINI